MRILLALAGVAAAGVMAVSTANAQDCVNGYRTLGNGVVSLCDDVTGANQFAPGDPTIVESREQQNAAVPAGQLVDEPMTTGSIAPAPQVGDVPLESREQQAAALAEAGFPEEPVTTGSIAAAPAGGLPPDYREGMSAADGVAAPVVAKEAEGPWACQPGQYWIVGGEGRDTPVFCR